MDRNDQGNEDTRAAEAHTHNAQENRDALAAQNRRTEATAGDSANHPIQQSNQNSGAPDTSVMSATGRTSEDSSQAAANSSNAHENREALAEQNRRTQETTDNG